MRILCYKKKTTSINPQRENHGHTLVSTVEDSNRCCTFENRTAHWVKLSFDERAKHLSAFVITSWRIPIVLRTVSQVIAVRRRWMHSVLKCFPLQWRSHIMQNMLKKCSNESGSMVEVFSQSTNDRM